MYVKNAMKKNGLEGRQIMNSERIELLKDKLKIKQKELDDYVLDINNDYLSEEAEEMRAEIYNLQNEISKKESNYNLVEEDIKKIEEIINWLKDSSYPYDISLTRDDIQSLENLIKGYRELEYKYNKALTDLSIETKRTNEENYRCSLFAVENNDLKEKLADSIPKSQIKSKIEELDKQRIKMEKDDIGVGFTLGNNWSDLKAKIQVLQELMEDK